MQWIEYKTSPLIESIRLSPIYVFQREWSYRNRVEKSNGTRPVLTFCTADWEFRIVSNEPYLIGFSPALQLIVLRRSTVIKTLTYDIALRTKTSDFEDTRAYSVTFNFDGSDSLPDATFFPIPGWNNDDWLEFDVWAKITAVEDQNGKIFQISHDLKDQTQSLKYCQLLDFFSFKHLPFCVYLFCSLLIAIAVFWLSSPMMTVCVSILFQFVALWCICHWYLGWDHPIRDLIDIFSPNFFKVCDWFNDCPSQLH